MFDPITSSGISRALRCLSVCVALGGCASLAPQADPAAELRGTWITTTANRAVATPQDTRETMRRLKDIGLNTVYVEVWKNGYTQHPSEVLKRVIGVDRRPARVQQDPSDAPERVADAARDLTGEMLIEAHRHGLIAIAWFEYGFMAAHQSTMNHLRRMKPDWLSRDIDGKDVAPNGFVWMNPLHPEARRFLTDLVLETIDRYDLDGIQLDDRIVWPYVTMGYDEFTQAAYAKEHGGARPPKDPRDPAWMRWRADKVNEFAKQFVAEIRARRPGLVISLSPAVYPWSWDYYLLEWPRWAAWGDPRWDEFIPQAYRFSYEAFEKTWRDQVAHMKELGANRQRDLMAGIRTTGDGKDSTWEQLRDSIQLTRTLGNGGHVLWYSKGVLDTFSNELKTLYAAPARNPHFPAQWRPGSRPLFRDGGLAHGGEPRWVLHDVPPGTHRLIGFDGVRWEFVDRAPIESRGAANAKVIVEIPAHYREVEILADRRDDMRRPRRPLNP